MLDPFPIAPFPALSKVVQPWADYFALPTLPLHIHELLLATLLYECVFLASPIVSGALFPTGYRGLSPTKRLNWDVHVVSFVQSTMINGLAIWVMFSDEERWNMDWQERVYGYTGAAAMIQALAAGYFLWDLLVTVFNMHIFGIGMLAHAVSALLVYSFGFRPFVNYYSTNFILWELSSPFLNIHWFFDKLNMTGSKPQLYNGLMLITTFFFCRLVWGSYQSFRVAQDVWMAVQNKPTLIPTTADVARNVTVPTSYESTMRFASDESSIPLWLAVIYIGANLTLNSLNCYWFVKMIDAVRKRFTPKQEEKVDKSPDGGVSTGAEKANGLNGTRRRTRLDGEEHDVPPPAI